MAALPENASIVCVTGAGEDAKYTHLKNLEKASENLKLFKADLLDYDSLYAAIKGCSGVFHVASPLPSGSVPNPEVELVEPAVKGTLNVLKACSAANVRRTVVVSSLAAVFVNPNLPEEQVRDETCWSDTEYCKKTNNWYCFSKTVAESEAFEYANQNGLNVVTLCPSLVLGPMLQHAGNFSSSVLIKLVREGCEEIENNLHFVVDVRDVAEALLLVYERLEAEGRHICTAHSPLSSDMVEILRRKYPNLNYPKRFEDSRSKISSEKLRRLGWKYRPLEETLIDSIESYKQAGLAD